MPLNIILNISLNMFGKKLFFILLIFILAISAVSAENLNTTDDSVAIDEKNVSTVSDDTDSLSDDEGTFSQLQDMIDNATEGSTITLGKNYSYDDGFSQEGISITKNIIINGNNFTLNGKNSGRIFDNTANEVTLNQINFVNGNYPYLGSGGAIHSKNTLIVTGCTFKNNHGVDDGGAIYSYGTLILSDCTFKDNYCDSSGGALKVSGETTITNCKFENNHAQYYGGAIEQGFSGNLNINYCNFTNNYVTGNDENDGDGGAIKALDGNLKLNNTIFRSNKAATSGGAIDNFANAEISNSLFEKNTAGEYGGAIDQHSGSLNITNSNFTANYVNGESQYGTYGGAIYDSYGNAKITDCCFENNSADNYGGAIYGYADTTVRNSTFIKNSAQYGGAMSDGIAIQCSFEGNSIPWLSEVDVRDCYFKKDKVLITLDKSGSQYGQVILTVKVKNQDKNTYLSDMLVKLAFSNGTYFILKTNSEGAATYSIPFAPATYSVAADLESEYYDCPQVKLSNIKIAKAKANIEVTPLSTTYSSGKYFQIKVTYANTKKPISGIKLKLKVYTGKKYKTVSVTTNSNGIVKYDASSLSIGTHKIIVSPNDSKITAESKTSSVKISKAALTITAPKSVGLYKKTTKFTVTVKNKASGKVVSGIKVTFQFKVNGKSKTITAKTNSKGQASFTSKSLSVGNNKVKVATTANTNYKAASKQGTVEIVKSKISTSIKCTSYPMFVAHYSSGILVGYTTQFDLVDAHGNILYKNIDVYSSSRYVTTIKSHVFSLIPGNCDGLTFKFKGDAVYLPSSYSP